MNLSFNDGFRNDIDNPLNESMFNDKSIHDIQYTKYNDRYNKQKSTDSLNIKQKSNDNSGLRLNQSLIKGFAES